MIVLWLAACTGNTVPEVRPGPPLIAARDVVAFEVDAELPTDLLPLPGDALLVLDGYRQRAVVVDGAGATVRELGHPAWGRPVRIAARPGGYWLTDPGDHDTQPVLLAIGEDGTPDHGVVVRDGDVELRPVGVAPGLVGARDGTVRFLGDDGAVTATVGVDVDGEAFGSIVDVSPRTWAGPGVAGTGWLVVDALGHRVHEVDHTGARAFWGRFGEWPGTFQRATSAASTARGNVIATDSALGVAQVFHADGPILGLVADGEADVGLRFAHPIAVRADDDDPTRYYVLDQGGAGAPARVVSFRIADADEVAAEDHAEVRFLRVSLARDPVEPGEKLCVQCHDGLVVDSRENWDPARGHHPVDVAPEHVTVSEDLPLRDGKLVCTTCHSPHAEGETFLRDATGDAGEPPGDSPLCASCHGEAAHEEYAKALGLTGTAHPVGAALADALGGRDPSETGACLDCHAPHGAAGDPILREGGGGTCVACHADHASGGHDHPTGRRLGRDVPPPREGAALVLSRDGGVQCRTCHDLVGGTTSALLRAPRDGGVLCLACHAEPEGFGESPHASMAERGIACLGCHDPHGAPADAHFLRTASHASAEDPDGCLGCHGPKGRAAKAGVAPGVVGHPVGVGAGERSVASCETCHDAHAATIPAITACEGCHELPAAAKARGGHGGATCLDCHPAHAEPRTAAGPDPVASRCLGCHAPGSTGSTRHVARFDHPAPLFLPDGSRWEPLGTLPLYDELGNRVAPGANGNLSCGTCHETHGPGADGRGELRRDGWREACAACHGPDALLYYREWHSPEKRKGAP